MDPNQQQYQQYAQPSGMSSQNPNYMQPQSAPKHHSWLLIVLLVLFILLTVAGFSFSVWAFGQQQNYKNNSDKISAKAVAIAIQQEDSKKDNEFLEREKSPLKNYLGPETYGSLDISYPRTWSAYIVAENQAVPVDGFFHPNFVPGIQSKTAYALRVRVVARTYEQELKQFEGKVKSGKVTLSPYAPQNVKGVTGSRVEGEINLGQKDAMILLPLRDKTIELSTESQDFINDFNNTVLPSLKFIP